MITNILTTGPPYRPEYECIRSGVKKKNGTVTRRAERFDLIKPTIRVCLVCLLIRFHTANTRARIESNKYNCEIATVHFGVRGPVGGTGPQDGYTHTLDRGRRAPVSLGALVFTIFRFSPIACVPRVVHIAAVRAQ